MLTIGKIQVLKIICVNEKGITLSDICRKTKLSYSFGLNILHDFEKKGIVKSVKKGRTRPYIITATGNKVMDTPLKHLDMTKM